MPRAEASMRCGGLAALLVALGCGTLSGTRQYQSIDSTPRGLEVTDVDAGEVLGTTPFFAHLERERSQHFSVRAVGLARAERRDVSCSYRWGGSLVGNVAWMSVGSSLSAGGAAGLYGAAVGVDLLTGAAWSCPDRILLEVPELEGLGTSARCPRYVVVPPTHADEQVALHLARAWAEAARTRPCTSVLEPGDTAASLARFNVTHDETFDPALVQRERLNAIGFAARASHLTVLASSVDGTKVTLRPRLYDLHSLAAVDDAPLVVDLAEAQGLTRHPVLAFVGTYVKLLPNSIGFAASARELDYTPTGDVTSVAVSTPASVLPSVLGNLTFLWLDPPERLDPWHASFRLSPGGGISWNSRLLTLQRREGAGEVVDALAVFLQGNVNATVAWRTPVGVLSAGVGLGPGLTVTAVDSAYDDLRLNLWVTAELAWTLFVTQSVFVRATADVHHATSPASVGDGYALDGYQGVGLTVGYYLPEFRSWVRTKF